MIRRCHLFLPLKEMEESEFERQKQGLASILAEAMSAESFVEEEHLVFLLFFVWVQASFCWEDMSCLLRLSLVLKMKHVH